MEMFSLHDRTGNFQEMENGFPTNGRRSIDIPYCSSNTMSIISSALTFRCFQLSYSVAMSKDYVDLCPSNFFQLLSFACSLVIQTPLQYLVSASSFRELETYPFFQKAY